MFQLKKGRISKRIRLGKCASVACVLATLITLIPSAETHANYDANLTTTITHVSFYSYETILIKTADPFPTTCPLTDFLAIAKINEGNPPQTAEGRDNLRVAALTAYALGATVIIGYDGDGSDCVAGGRARIYRIGLD